MEQGIKTLIESYIKMIYKSQKIRTKKGFEKITVIGTERINKLNKGFIKEVLINEIDTTFGIDENPEILKIIDKYVR